MAAPVDAVRLVACAAPAPFAAHAPFAALRWCRLPVHTPATVATATAAAPAAAATATAATAATPLHEAARLLGRTPDAILCALRGAGDVPLGGDAVWDARVAQLPAEWRVSARAQRRTLITAAALLVYIRVRLRDAPRHPIQDAAVRDAVRSLRGYYGSGDSDRGDGAATTAAEAVAVAAAASAATSPLPPRGRPLQRTDEFAQVFAGGAAVRVPARDAPVVFDRDAFVAAVLRPVAAALGFALLPVDTTAITTSPAAAATAAAAVATAAAAATSDAVVRAPPVRRKRARVAA